MGTDPTKNQKKNSGNKQQGKNSTGKNSQADVEAAKRAAEEAAAAAEGDDDEQEPDEQETPSKPVTEAPAPKAFVKPSEGLKMSEMQDTFDSSVISALDAARDKIISGDPVGVRNLHTAILHLLQDPSRKSTARMMKYMRDSEFMYTSAYNAGLLKINANERLVVETMAALSSRLGRKVDIDWDHVAHVLDKKNNKYENFRHFISVLYGI